MTTTKSHSVAAAAHPLATDTFVRLARVVLPFVAFAVVLFAHGLLPGFLPDAPSAYLAEGAIRCLNDLGPSIVATHCHSFGEPLGYPLLTGGPVLLLGALIMYLPGIESYGAYLTAMAGFDAIALAGGYALMRRLGASRAVALGTATVYLLTPTVIGMRSFGGTFVGFALLPAYAWCDLTAIGALVRGSARWVVMLVAGYAVVRTGALFIDGYSFVASALVGGFLWLEWLVARTSPRLSRRALGAATFVAANVIAVAIYRLYVPTEYDPNPIGLFRSMGADVVTLLTPTEFVWLAGHFGYASDHRALWGDGSNAIYNYAGLVCLVLAVVYLVTRPRRREAVALAAAGLVALCLSLGPSLKVDEARPEVTSQPSFEDYLMPEGLAAAELPWADVFTSVPGIDSMRATYRWLGVTRLALIVLAGLMIGHLARAPGGRRWAAVALAVVGTAEIAPNLSLFTQSYKRGADDVAAVRSELEPDLRRATSVGERVFFLTYDGSHNDYMVNFLAAGADLRAYNAGGDKNVTMAQRTWPPAVAALIQAPVSPDAVMTALDTDAVDVVIAPFFHPRWSSYAWPPSDEVREQADNAFAPVLNDRRFDVHRYEWFATARLPHRLETR